jgi:hypothetical protein
MEQSPRFKNRKSLFLPLSLAFFSLFVNALAFFQKREHFSLGKDKNKFFYEA